MKLPGQKMLLATAPFILFTIGCSPYSHMSSHERLHDEDILCGGHISRTRTDVPHTVESTELASFSILFDFNDPYTLEWTGFRSYTLERNDGVWKLTADGKTIDVTQEHVDDIERMIRRYDLAALNGVSEYTAGLPPMGNEFSFRISYASGESISAGGNTVRHGNWGIFKLPFKRYVDELFVAAGHTEFAYPPEVFRIDSFSLDMRQPVENDILERSVYLDEKQITGEYTVKDIAEERFDESDFAPYLFDAAAWRHEDGTTENIYERSVPWSEELAADLQNVLAAHNLDIYDDIYAVKGTAYYLSVQYESGRSIQRAAAGKLPTPQEAELQSVFIKWTDRVFDEHRDEAEIRNHW